MLFTTNIRRLLVVGGLAVLVLAAGARATGPSTLMSATGWYDAKVDCGLVGNDPTHDDAPALQSCLDTISSTGKDATIFFPTGTYYIKGNLQDTTSGTLSNAQIILPRKNDGRAGGDLISIRLLGPTPAPLVGTETGGAILQSTLSSGNGAMIGVHNPSGPFESSRMSLTLEDLTFKMPQQTTSSALDLRYIANVTLRNVKVDTTNTQLSGSYPDPSTASTSSYGIRTPVNNVPDTALLDNVQVQGFYNGLQVGELADLRDVTVDLTRWPVEIHGPLYHAVNFDRLLITNSVHGIIFTGGNSYVTGAQLDIDQNTDSSNPWWNHVDDLTDPNNYGHGTIHWHTVRQDVGPSGDFARTGGDNLNLVRIGSETEGATLTVTSNTVSPTNLIQRVGAGLIKTITVPPGFTQGTITLIAGTTPFTTDATGNISRQVSPAAGQAVSFTYTPSNGKWNPS